MKLFTALFLSVLLTACAIDPPAPVAIAPAKIKADVQRLLPTSVSDRNGWSNDIQSVFSALKLPPDPDHLCAVIAVVGQESSFRADPTVPGLAEMSRQEIIKRAQKLGIPELAVRLALSIKSPNGKSYDELLNNVKTERDLSRLFEEFTSMVPLGKRLLAGFNPIRTGGPMQVSVSFAETYAKTHRYPFPMQDNIRNEVFSRLGGLYFGTAHLLDYPSSYPQMVYRFADFNAGRYASRNAAFQQAVEIVSGQSLDFDGDLLLPDEGNSDVVSATEKAVRSLAGRLNMSFSDIRYVLGKSDQLEFEKTTLYARVFAWADEKSGKPLPRAIIPNIRLQSPKITRALTTEWFANRVNERYGQCLAKKS